MRTPVTRVEGRAIPFGRANVDTDIIIPAVHLKTLSRVGLGAYAFEALRREPGNVFDDPALAGAPILIAGANFGCGSSREHAVWALLDRGISAVVAPSFSDIFASNAFKNGLAAVALDEEAVARLLDLARIVPIAVDLEQETVLAGNEIFSFALDPFRRDCLVKGLDEIALTLESDAAIAAYEAHAPLLACTISVPAGGNARSLSSFERSRDHA
jgi:3-isopropylmalate/(R)-2-methylmalate dehydratase small subunit